MTHKQNCPQPAFQEYQKKYPYHCTTCQATGLIVTPQTWDEPEWAEDCDDCLGQDICPRCRDSTSLEYDERESKYNCNICLWDSSEAEMNPAPPDECECYLYEGEL